MWQAKTGLAALSLVMAASSSTSASVEPVPAEERPCGWSEEWLRLRERFSSVPEGAELEAGKRIKGDIRRPRSDVDHVIRGLWRVEAVIDEKGAVRDAKIIAKPQITPAWPEYEKAIVEAIRKWKYEPVKVNGKPWPQCTTVTVREQ